jgi:TRAP transporter TAXI family solute receptor
MGINVLTGGTAPASTIRSASPVQDLRPRASKAPRTQVQATKASVENLNLLQQGKGEIAFSLGDSLKQEAWKRQHRGRLPGPLDKLRGIAAIYPNYIQIVASKESGIKTLADLKGKSLSVGAPKSGTELNARAILAAAGMKYEDLGKVEYLPFAESVELIKNRQLDATLQSAGLGVASIRDLANSVEIVVVEIPAEVVTKAGPPFQAGVDPANTYQGQTANAVSAALGPELPGLPAPTSPKTRLQHDQGDLRQHSGSDRSARRRPLDQAGERRVRHSPVPLHPGAARTSRKKA